MSNELMTELQVHLARDTESGWWYIAASDIPGLVLEAETPAALIEKIEAAAPEIIELNCEEILANHMTDERKRALPPRTAPQSWSYRPIFDSPLQACA